jgi:hypothetical protein
MKQQTKISGSGCLVGVGSALLLSISAMGQVIYSDSFAAADGTLGIGRTPDVSVGSAFSGSTYAEIGYNYGNYGGTGVYEAVYSGAQALRGDFGLGLPFGSSPGYATLGASQFQIQADLLVNNLNYGSSPGSGIGVGFYSAVGSGLSHGYSGFTGLTIDAEGNLDLIKNGSSLYASTGLSGFGASTVYTVSYDINALSGAISGITVNGNSVSLNFGANANDLFEGSALNYVGVYGSEPWNWPSAEYGTADNFSVAAAPEPTSLALFSTGIGALCVVMRRKRS